ncbi:MAG: hypothetical protein GXP52_00440 [Deltaproteobacteria bacterium]|nr:hypothetical protein [Deltaproteobacteria bacterium]
MRTVSHHLSSRLSRHSSKSDGGSCNPCDLSAIARRADGGSDPMAAGGAVTAFSALHGIAAPMVSLGLAMTVK